MKLIDLETGLIHKAMFYGSTADLKNFEYAKPGIYSKGNKRDFTYFDGRYWWDEQGRRPHSPFDKKFEKIVKYQFKIERHECRTHKDFFGFST